MAVTIDYFMTSVSPWAYLGHRPIQDLARRHGAALVVRPINLGELFKVSGQVSLAERPAVRRRYRDLELQRWSEFRGRKASLKPKHFPTDPSQADHAIIALVEAGADPLPFMDKVYSAVWADDLQIADPAVLAGLLSDCGHDADAILAAAATPEVAAIRARNTADAIAVDAVGVPSYVLGGEAFWGQDRIDLLDHAISTGRPPIRSGA